MKNISDEQKIYELSLIWKEAEYNFAFWNKINDKVNWDEEYKQALKRVLKTKNLYEYYMELSRFISKLKDGHTFIYFPKEVQKDPQYFSYLPISTDFIEGKIVIDCVDDGVKDLVKPFSIIKKFSGIPIKEYIENNIFPYIWHEKPESNYWEINNHLLRGALNSEVELELEYEGKIETVVLERTKNKQVYSKNRNVSIEGELKEFKSFKLNITKDGIMIITIDTFMNNELPKELYDNFELLKKAKGIIINISQNSGGNGYYSGALAALFIGKEFEIDYSKTQVHIASYKAWSKNTVFSKTYEEYMEIVENKEYFEKLWKIPKHEYYKEDRNKLSYDIPGLLKVPVMIVISAVTASAAEDFLIMMRGHTNATIVGTPSYGSTGQPLNIYLESGGRVGICTRQCLMLDGTDFTNKGIIPDIYIEETIESVKANRSLALEKALELLREKLK